MKIQLNKLLPFMTLIILLSCNQKEKFNAEIWRDKGVDWWMTDVRENMIEDLVSSKVLIGLTRKEVKDLLGETEKSEKQTMEYLIREKYGSDIDPEYISYLKIKLDRNQKAISCKINKN